MAGCQVSPGTVLRISALHSKQSRYLPTYAAVDARIGRRVVLFGALLEAGPPGAAVAGRAVLVAAWAWHSAYTHEHADWRLTCDACVLYYAPSLDEGRNDGG